MATAVVVPGCFPVNARPPSGVGIGIRSAPSCIGCGDAPGSSGLTGTVAPGGGTKDGAGFKSDGGMGTEPGGACGTPVAPIDGMAGVAVAAGATGALGRPGAGIVGCVGAGTYSYPAVPEAGTIAFGVAGTAGAG